MDRERRYVVVGAGDVGVACAYRLARAVAGRVLLLDARPRSVADPHTAGPRPVAPAHPDEPSTACGTVAHEAWRELERVSGLPVLRETGSLTVADRSRLEVVRLAAHADRHGLDFEVLDAAAVARRWPQVRLAAGEQAFAQRRGGLLDPTRAAAAHLALARGHGAEVRHATPVRALHPRADRVEVVLDDEVLVAEHVVVAAGTGTAALLDGVRDLPLTTTVEESAQYTPLRLLDVVPERLPALTWYDGAARFEGTGAHGAATTRLVQHGGALDPRTRAAFLAAHLPGFAGPDGEHDTHRRAVAVLPDGGIVLDTLVEAPRLSVVAGTGQRPGLAALLGRVVAGLALTGRSRRALDAWSLDRAALVDAPARR